VISLFKSVVALSLAAVVAAPMATAEPTYKAKVPQSLITPDEVDTEYLGELEFRDGFPSDSTVEKSLRFLDTARAVDLFMNAMGATSLYAMLDGHAKIGMKPNDVGITEGLMNARSLWLTPQTTTPYATAEIDVKTGPVIIELDTPVLGIIDDAFFLHVSDIGLTGPDKGKGGKYLIVGPGYEGAIPDGVHVVRTKTYRHWLLMRVFVRDGDVQAAVDAFKAGFHMYPLAESKNPPKQKFFNLTDKQYNTIHANDESYFDELNAVIQYESADAFNPEIVGLAASIGIKKGEPFEPDARMKGILKEAAAIANAASRSILFRPRDREVYFYPDRQWFSPLAGGSHEFLDRGERVLDDRVMFYYFATGITPAMSQPKVGQGSVYEIAAHDANGDYLDGGKNYSVTLPGPVPINNFWSFMVYDGQTRSILETDQQTGGVDSNSPGLAVDADGSATVWFGPKPPEGHETNWVQTIPGKGFHVLLRLYGPLEPWFDKTWKPGDFMLVD